MAVQKGCRLLLISAFLVTVIIVINTQQLFFSWHGMPAAASKSIDHIVQQAKKARLPFSTNGYINNRTLGFDKIFVLSLPERSDKRDAIQLSASLTNLDIEWINGVDGDTIPDVAVPPAFFDPDADALTRRPQLGSWRGHINAIREIVAQGLGSTIILEDDVDWDVHIVNQLEKFANASRELLSSVSGSSNSPKHLMLDSPYGPDWDILWLGHCGGWSPALPAREHQVVIETDPTVPPAFHIQDLLKGFNADAGPCAAHPGRDPQFVTCNSPRLMPDQRLVQIKGSPTCSFAYALSQKGARKVLLKLGGPALGDVNASFDTKLTEVCRGDMDSIGGEETKCLTVSPPYFVHHRPRGSTKGDSDINVPEGNSTEGKIHRDIGITKGIVWSARLNAENLIEGKEVESQYAWANDREGWRCKKPDEYRGRENEKPPGYNPGAGGG